MPIVTVIGIGIALLIGGAVVTETVFAIPGIGRLTVDAILRRDYPIIQGVILIFSGVYVLINLLVDLSYTCSTRASVTDMTAIAIDAAAPKSVSPTWRRFRDAFRRHPTAIVGGVVLLAMILIAVFAPWLGTVDPQALAPVKRLKQPSAEYWFGTDMLGRDVYSRVIYGARVSLTVGIAVALFSTLVGLAIGLVTGFIRWLDAIVMRVMDGLMSIPRCCWPSR